jgi:opacity protein-like surface antigen/outer membrane protease
MCAVRFAALTIGIGCLAAAAPPPALADGSEATARSAAASFNWSGYYVGAQLGGLANLSEISDPLGPSLFGNPNLASGPFAGLQAGYNYQSGVVVYGLEADIALPQVEGTSTCSARSGAFINSNCKVGVDAFGTLTGRLGLALGQDGRSLVYGKAGAAWYTGSLDLATNDSTTGAAGNPFTTRNDDLSHWGWTLGAGAEYALSGPWSVKAEYDYASFSNDAVTLLPSAVIDPTGAVVDTVGARRGHVSNDLHSFKLGLNYRFGQPGAPLDAPGSVSLKDGPAPVQQPYSFELGGRYWYSWGRHKYDLGLGKADPVASYSLISRLTYDDIDASTGEVTGRLTAPWNLFAKGFVGGGSLTGGQMNDEDYNIPGDNVARVPYTNTLSPKVAGQIPTYGTIDIGYDVWRAPTYRLGGYVGYNYYRETMGAYGVYQTANPDGPFGPNVMAPLPPTGHAIIGQEATWQSVRLGAATEFRLAPRLKLSGDAAFLPFVTVDAQDTHYQGNTADIASINPLHGNGVGTQLEAMLSYDVTDQISLGVGARYWAMWSTNGSFERSYDATQPVTYPLPHQHLKIETERAGVLGQVLYKFD